MILKNHHLLFVIEEFFYHEMIEDNHMIEDDHEENCKYQLNNTHQLLKEIKIFEK